MSERSIAAACGNIGWAEYVALRRWAIDVGLLDLPGSGYQAGWTASVIEAVRTVRLLHDGNKQVRKSVWFDAAIEIKDRLDRGEDLGWVVSASLGEVEFCETPEDVLTIIGRGAPVKVLCPV